MTSERVKLERRDMPKSTTSSLGESVADLFIGGDRETFDFNAYLKGRKVKKYIAKGSEN